MLRKTLLIVFVVFWGTFPVQADVPLGGTARHKLAQFLLEQLTTIEKWLPALSAEDQTRIAKETKETLASGNIMRFRTLMEGPYQTLWSVRQHFDPMLGAISALANSQYDDKQAEVEMWSLTAKKMSEGAFYFGLEKLGVSKAVFPPILVQGAPPQEKFHEFRSNIHNNILLPYIQGQLPD